MAVWLTVLHFILCLSLSLSRLVLAGLAFSGFFGVQSVSVLLQQQQQRCVSQQQLSQCGQQEQLTSARGASGPTGPLPPPQRQDSAADSQVTEGTVSTVTNRC